MAFATRVLSKTSDQYKSAKDKQVVKFDAKIAKAISKGDTFNVNKLKHDKEVMLTKYNYLIQAWVNIESELLTKKASK